MHAIVELGSLQYKVAEGDVIEAERLKEKADKEITFEKVLLLVDGDNVRVGQPYLNDVKITAKVVGETQGEKLISFKYQRRKNNHWKKGHRQKLTALSISKILT